MTPTTTVGDWAGDRLAHEAVVFDRDDQVRARVLPYVREGLERGESMVVVASDTVRGIIADEFGSATDEFAVFADSIDHWAGGWPETLAANQEGMTSLIEAGLPWRRIGEPVWMALPGGDVWSRYEAIANEAFSDYPYYSLCLHDTRRLSPELVDNALRTHPLLWDGTEVTPSPHYQSTEAFLRSQEPLWSRAPDDREGSTVTRAGEARHLVHAGMPPSASHVLTGDVVLAVHELVVNAITAAGAAEVTHWRENGAVVWEVSDDGLGMHETAAGYTPPRHEQERGRGLWIARTLADEATVRPYGPGTAVRLWFALHDAPGDTTGHPA
jgi:anti-sigma regulatory factor (Ser/Thr protein kinase)